MVTKKAKKTTTPTEAVVVKGNHLTVTTHPDGRTELEWDDQALLEEVRAALAGVETTPKKKAPAKKTVKAEEPVKKAPAKKKAKNV